ncbi:MAG: hypothetical protein K2Y42_10315 [Hyphomicrobium sp.]|jgi:hypothetical protein|uniref:hypothetical protein n=1 Tax=Hyphomicrobium sp. TaxID=82 RepID=UPI0025B8EF78|nr:hypothetical protein [Hyphomicrobium sp.]MBX9863133.1 hypothetical protein [Hyphomicrobium sp.]
MTDTRSHDQKMEEMRRRFDGARTPEQSHEKAQEKSRERAREQDPSKPTRDDPSRAPRLRR